MSKNRKDSFGDACVANANANLVLAVKLYFTLPDTVADDGEPLLYEAVKYVQERRYADARRCLVAYKELVESEIDAALADIDVAEASYKVMQKPYRQ